jgi:CubicO group peptidase (beta-lactamase class C family)
MPLAVPKQSNVSFIASKTTAKNCVTPSNRSAKQFSIRNRVDSSVSSDGTGPTGAASQPHAKARKKLKGAEWETASPISVGFDQALLQTLVQKIREGEFENIHSLLVIRGGKLVVEEYFWGEDERRGEPLGIVSFGPSKLHDLRSVTKSMISALFGIALGNKPNRSIDDSVLSYFPEYKDLQTPDRLAIRLRDLLSMTAGWEWNEDLPYRDPLNSETQMDAAADRYRFILERPIVAKPGQQFTYNGGCTALLAAVIERWTKMPLDKYAEQTLFKP